MWPFERGDVGDGLCDVEAFQVRVVVFLFLFFLVGFGYTYMCFLTLFFVFVFSRQAETFPKLAVTK